MANQKNSIHWAVIVTLLVTLFELSVFCYIVAASHFHLTLSQYFAIVLVLVMFISTSKYAIDYFVKHNMNASLSGLIFRYAVSLTSIVLNANNANNIRYTCIVLILLLAPYLAGSIKTNSPKKNAILIVIILILSLGIGISNIITVHREDVYKLGKFIFCFDSCVVSVQWILFTMLFFTRTKNDKDIFEANN